MTLTTDPVASSHSYDCLINAHSDLKAVCLNEAALWLADSQKWLSTNERAAFILGTARVISCLPFWKIFNIISSFCSGNETVSAGHYPDPQFTSNRLWPEVKGLFGLHWTIVVSTCLGHWATLWRIGPQIVDQTQQNSFSALVNAQKSHQLHRD